MTRTHAVIDVTESNLVTLPCCGIKNPAHGGRCQKDDWLRAQFQKGLRAKMMLGSDHRPCAYIEYVPGEYTWRGVDARGYLFIHCVWTFAKPSQNRGVASTLVGACLQDARKAGMRGVAVLTREGPWLGGSALFLKNGFKVVATAAPDYQLLVNKLESSAPDPSFKGDWDKKLKKYSRGLTIIRSQQCPHIAKFADEIAETAVKEYGLSPKVVKLESHRDAQNAPTPYAVFSIIYDGRLLADHQISRTRFRNLMRTLQA